MRAPIARLARSMARPERPQPTRLRSGLRVFYDFNWEMSEERRLDRGR